MPAELAYPAPAPSASTGPTAEDRWAAIGIAIRCIKLIAKYLEQDDQRTKENDAEALRRVCQHSDAIFSHIEACPVVAAGFAQETRVILYRLALVHREHVAKQPPPPPPRKSASRDPRKRLPSPPEPVAEPPHKDMSNDGGAARTHARRAPLATQPYQRSARPTTRKHKKVEDVEDVPEAIAASVRAAQDAQDEQLPTVLGPVSIADLTTPSLDDLCALFGSTSLGASAPAASSAAEDALCDPAPAGANRDAYLPTHVPAPTPAPGPPPAAPSSRGVRAKSVPPARVNPLDRSGRRRGKTAQL